MENMKFYLLKITKIIIFCMNIEYYYLIKILLFLGIHRVNMIQDYKKLS